MDRRNADPLWTLKFQTSTEIEACSKFWSVAMMAGRRRRREGGIRDGVRRYRDMSNPVFVAADPAGFAGSWLLRLTEDVSVPLELSEGGLPSPKVGHKLRVYSHDVVGVDDESPEMIVTEIFLEEQFVRPPLLVHVSGEFGRPVPTIELERPANLLDVRPAAGMWRLARYIAWLEIAQDTLLRHRAVR